MLYFFYFGVFRQEFYCLKCSGEVLFYVLEGQDVFFRDTGILNEFCLDMS